MIRAKALRAVSEILVILRPCLFSHFGGKIFFFFFGFVEGAHPPSDLMMRAG